MSSDPGVLTWEDLPQEERFLELYQTYSTRIKKWVGRRSHKLQDPEALEQEFWLKIWSEIHNFSPRGDTEDLKKSSTASWVFLVLSRRFLDQTEKDLRRSKSTASWVDIDESIFGYGDPPDQQILETESYTTTKNKLEKCIRSLDSDKAEILSTSFLDLDQKTQAELLDIPFSTYRSKLYRTRQELKQLFYQ